MFSTSNNASSELSSAKDATFAFLTKSLVEVQRNAESDLQLMASRAKQVSETIGEWPNMKLPGPKGEQVSPVQIFEKLKQGGHALAKKHSLDDLYSLPGLSTASHSLSKDPHSLLPSESSRREPFWPILRFPELSESISIENWQNQSHWQISAEPWEPWKKAAEHWKELEANIAQNHPAGEFIQKVTKHIVKSPSESDMSSKARKVQDVLPLDVPELLESLVRQSEPFFDQIGVKKEVYAKVYTALQKYGRNSNKKNLAASEAEVGDGSPLKEDLQQKFNLEARIASVLQSTGYKHNSRQAGEKYVPDKEGKRNIAIFTTASLPWMTGTAVNPLLRAAYLAKSGKQNVTLVVPWLSKQDQEKVYPNQITFDSPVEQEQYVRDWLKARIGFLPEFKIRFYPGLFCTEKRSILGVGDISSFVPDKEADVAVLEEPEHLTWYYHGRQWTEKFRNVVGIVHTNYLEYVRREKNGRMQAFLLEHVNNWMVRCYCHKVVRLSAATQDLPRSTVCNVHGVGVRFLEIGSKVADSQKAGKASFSKGAYYLGKMVWSKGYRELIDLFNEHKNVLGSMKVDVYGSGEDSDAVQSEAVKNGLKIKFHKGRDHADSSIQEYKVFINPSMSDVVCTTTAEALAMGKIVVCAEHPSNEFFLGFPNCLTYKTNEEFVDRVKQAMSMEPVPLSEEQRHLLSWEAATDRFLECAGLDSDNSGEKVEFRAPPLKEIKSQADLRKGRSLLRTLSLSMSVPDIEDVMDRSLFMAHNFLSGIETARVASGAPPKSKQCDSEMRKELGLAKGEMESSSAKTTYGL